jgi:heterodisulfide reductase subunit A-like polyferredoxin
MAKKVGSVLVVGGGIGGMQSALDLADSGFKVYLLEQTPSIGGTMAQLDKTFPTNDCSMCILSPKMVDVARHPNIELLTYSDLISIDGHAGNFKVKFRQKPRYIDIENCTGCAECTKVCPVELPNEFDMGEGIRKAIYIPFPQAVPLKATIDKHGMHPCRDACPAGVGAPGYVTLVSRGKFYEALRVIKERLPFPSICGRVCHRPCENVCTRKDIDEPVGIAHIKRFVGDLELKIPVAKTPPIIGRAENVAIIGGGPAGLTAAHDLALKGYHVTIFDSAPVLGGMMKFGIPTFRLPKEILRREISNILSLGVKVHLNTAVGKDLIVPDLFKRGYKAVFLAVGAQKGKKMNIPGEELIGVFQSIDFLKEVNLGEMIKKPFVTIINKLCVGCGLCAPSCIHGAIKLSPDKVDPKKQVPEVIKYFCVGCGKCASVCPSKAIRLSGFRDIIPNIGKKVVVIGGGNAALDTARTALRLGAIEVAILYRRTREEMPAEPDWEIDETEQEGIKLVYLVAPTRAIGDKNGNVKEIECIKMELLDELDNSGRRKIKPISGSKFKMEVDSIILAIGQEVDSELIANNVDLGKNDWNNIKYDPKSLPKNIEDNLKITSGGTIKVDPLTLETNIEGVFSGGDSIWGAGTVIEAIAAGKEAAISIDRYINGKDLRKGRGKKPKIAEVSIEDVKKKNMVPMRYLPLEARKKNFEEVELGYTEEQAIEEARRCLNCGGCSECYECVRVCEADAVNHDMKEKIIDIDVGAIIVASGFDLFDPTKKEEYGYGIYKNVVNSKEFERYLSASGPTAGKIFRPSDKKEPKKIAFLQCVGSRDERTNEYCSSVCCMYAIKQAIIAQEHTPGLKILLFFMDIRAFGKEFDDYYNRAEKEHGIKFIRSRIPSIEEDPKTKNLIISYLENEEKKQEEFDMVVLSCALESSDSSKELSEKLGIDLNEYGFCKTDIFTPLESSKPGIYVTGASTGPKDIPMTVTDASGAAAKASSLVASERHSQVKAHEFPPEMDTSEEPPRIGVFVCKCGINIAAYVDVPSVIEYAKTLPNVVHAEEFIYTCSQDTQKKIIDIIKKHKLNRVVVSACTPRTHEPLFQSTLREAGLNPHLFEMTNIREQCSWVHNWKPEKCTEKAKDLVRMAVSKASLNQPLKREELPVIPKGLVIGGGVSGMTAALELASQGFVTYLIERKNKLGGMLQKSYFLLGGEDPKKLLRSRRKEIDDNKKIHVFTNAEVKDVQGYVGNFNTKILIDGKKEKELEHGIIIVATGAKEYKPTEYLYGEDNRVLTKWELEEKLAKGSFLAKNVVMIQCVGCRNEERTYCSRVCCGDAIKNALKIRELSPDTNVYILYKDIRTYGFREKYYQEAAEKGIIFIRYEDENKPVVTKKNGLQVSVRDLILQREIILNPDMVVLSNAMLPQNGTKELSQMLKLPTTKDGFFLEAHMKLRPVDFATEGIFICGKAHSPKYIEECIAQASAAAARSVTILSKDKLEAEAVVSEVNEDLCSGCYVCIKTCPYSAIEVVDGKAKINPALCKGCGSCVTVCPSGSIEQKGFKTKQISAMIQAATVE